MSVMITPIVLSSPVHCCPVSLWFVVCCFFITPPTPYAPLGILLFTIDVHCGHLGRFLSETFVVRRMAVVLFCALSSCRVTTALTLPVGTMHRTFFHCTPSSSYVLSVFSCRRVLYLLALKLVFHSLTYSALLGNVFHWFCLPFSLSTSLSLLSCLLPGGAVSCCLAVCVRMCRTHAIPFSRPILSSRSLAVLAPPHRGVATFPH